jgi:hypothetical protein
MGTTLMILTIVVALIFFGALAYFVHAIARLLEAIGGRGDSFLAKLRLGLRAIETETAHLPVQVTKLNGGLIAVADGLKVVDGDLQGTIDAVVKQKG